MGARAGPHQPPGVGQAVPDIEHNSHIPCRGAAWIPSGLLLKKPIRHNRTGMPDIAIDMPRGRSRPPACRRQDVMRTGFVSSASCTLELEWWGAPLWRPSAKNRSRQARAKMPATVTLRFPFSLCFTNHSIATAHDVTG